MTRITIKTNLRAAGSRISKSAKVFTKRGFQLHEQNVQRAEELLKRHAPSRTGRLRASIKGFLVIARRTGKLFEYVSEVGSTVEYAQYPDTGTGPSPGRYIPGLMKRKSNAPLGMHPGTPARNYVAQAVGSMKAENADLSDAFIKTINTEVKRTNRAIKNEFK